MKRKYEIISQNMEEICSKVSLVERDSTPLGHTLINVNAIVKKSPNDLVELAMEIQKADSYVQANACNKLQIIAQQVRFLQMQAQEVLKEAKTNSDLHHAACNFVKVPGNVYHLYKRSSGQIYFSMLSKQDWNAPHEYLGSYRLENDHSWTPVENLQRKDDEMFLISKILHGTESKSICNALIPDTPMDI